MESLTAVGTERKVLSCCFDIIDKIIEAISIAAENDTTCAHILDEAGVLNGILKNLKEGNLSESVIAAVEYCEKKLKKCNVYLDKMLDRSMSRPRRYRCDLEQMKNEIDSAHLALVKDVSVQNVLQQQRADLSARSSKEEVCPIPGNALELQVLQRAHESPDAISHYDQRRWQSWKHSEKTAKEVHDVVPGFC